MDGNRREERGKAFMQLSGKVAIITGAGSGIGKASAELFAEEGAKVVAVDWNRANGENTAAIRDRGHNAIFCYADVSKREDVEAMVRTSVEKYGRLGVLFNNAAVQIMATLVDTTEETWDASMRSPRWCGQEAAQLLIWRPYSASSEIRTWRPTVRPRVE
jgi:NAD(P)-dependent dehydrogenase (short-subunit alcohol dehydrogenase family)